MLIGARMNGCHAAEDLPRGGTLRDWLTRVATALSLVLFAATLAIAVRSCFRFDLLQRWYLDRQTEFSGWAIMSNRGVLIVERFKNRGLIRRYDRVADGVSWSHYASEPRRFSAMTRTLGFDLRSEHDVSNEDRPPLKVEYWKTAIDLPYWFLAILFLMLPSRQFWLAMRRRQRVLSGLCPGCGYDLRGTPQRCPECGWTDNAGGPAAA